MTTNKDRKANVIYAIEHLRMCGANNPEVPELKAFILENAYLLTADEQIEAVKVLMRY